MDTITRRTGIIGWVIDHFFAIVGLVSMVGLLWGICALAERDSHYYENQRQLAYSAWCKMEHRTDISYTEWNALRQAGVLTKK